MITLSIIEFQRPSYHLLRRERRKQDPAFFFIARISSAGAVSFGEAMSLRAPSGMSRVLSGVVLARR